MLLMRLMLLESKKRLLDQGRMLEITICGPFALMDEEPEIWGNRYLGSHAWSRRHRCLPYRLCLCLQPGHPLWGSSLQAGPPGSWR